MEYEVEVFEVHAIKYRVEASDAASAIRAVQRGEAEYDEESLRFVRQLPCGSWQVRTVGSARSEPWEIAMSGSPPRAELARGSSSLRAGPVMRRRG